ncbi:hypothetical protein BX600DRAFT_289006 [Xylariales sp. PMI_506]|nr:hypothetical protein BX600DRAFT_289006 [Xylariales sp. PMI_506]
MPRWRSAATSGPSEGDAPGELQLPPNHVNAHDISDRQLPPGRFVSVVGLVKDFRAPISTGGPDWKCTLSIIDKSCENDGVSLTVIVFRPEDQMPDPVAGDIVHIHSAKVWSWQGEMCVITNRATEINIFPATDMPDTPRSLITIMKPTRKGRIPTEKELAYIFGLYHSMEKQEIPDVSEFKLRVDQSRNIKDKSCLLQDIYEGKFCDLLVHVVRDPYDQFDKVTIWVSDYTEHESFYKFTWDGNEESSGRDGDPYGYTSVNNAASRSWSGPYGKRSMQVTCFEPHASYVRSEVKAGDWIKLRNVQIKFGHNANNLEGFLREDRAAYGARVSVEVIDLGDDENRSARLKDAVRRRYNYENLAKKQKKSYAANEINKRKAETEAGPVNSKARRKEQRVALEKKFEEEKLRKAEMLGISNHVKCESLDQLVLPLRKLLEPVSYVTTIDGQKILIQLPFTNAKYRANVRVVDFKPRKLEDFSTWRNVTEFDMLSDVSGDENSDTDEGDGTLDRFTGKKVWEWRFALQLEDAEPKTGRDGQPDRLWVLVNNAEGQQLLNLDACDLRADEDELSGLREQLFKLWGNLEEEKARGYQRTVQSRKRLEAREPPPDSSDGEGNDTGDDSHRLPQTELGPVSNKPFSCCIRQYGVPVRDEDPERTNAGEGKRYERVFGLFGTRIC